MNKAPLKKLSYGIYIVSSVKDGRFNAPIANTVFQVTSEPPRVAISIKKSNLTHEFIESSGYFSVSFLKKESSFPFIGKFGFKSGRNVDKLEGCSYKIGKTGCPIILDNSLAYMEFKVVGKIDVGTPTLFIGELIEGKLLEDGEPLTYEYYKTAKKGKSPVRAPTCLKE